MQIKQFAIEDLSPDHQEGEKTENESAWSNFSAEATYKSYKLLEIDPNERHGGDRSADVEYSPCLPSISLIRIWHSATFIDYCTITLSSQPLSNMREREQGQKLFTKCKRSNTSTSEAS